MTRFLTLTLSLLLIATFCFAQVNPEMKSAPPPTVNQILDRYIEALGGKAALEKMTSCYAKGTFEMASMNLKGAYESYAKEGNKTLTIINLEGIGEIREGFDGQTGWSPAILGLEIEASSVWFADAT